MICVVALVLVASANLLRAGEARVRELPYPPSSLIKSVSWEWETYRWAAPGSDLWPVTWGPDNNLYLAWGDGGGFGGSDQDGRVGLGFARLEGSPEDFRGFNVNGGKNPENPTAFPKKGKTGGILFDEGVLYALVNLQDGTWPDVTHVLAWSTNRGAAWTRCEWVFPKGTNRFQPARFINFGKDGSGVPVSLKDYIYFYGVKIGPENSHTNLYLARAPRGKIREREAIQFFTGRGAKGQPVWDQDFAMAGPIFTDANGSAPAGMNYDPGLKRYLLACFHEGPGQLGLFEAREPWGPWSTVAYYNNWAGMGAAGEGLTCEFPEKWMSADGATVWAVFSAYGDGGKQGLRAHDRFNVVKVIFSIAR
ncbi:MAG TPA: DUF4185 domain-containing protein [Verrucomicrobiae bacterium]|nr:DUF4185 domain-containing protein [Verrucomicrobiae bacterium]